jgi:hypothetical protein
MSEPFHLWFVGLQDMDGFGDMPGAPGASLDQGPSAKPVSLTTE